MKGAGHFLRQAVKRCVTLFPIDPQQANSKLTEISNIPGKLLPLAILISLATISLNPSFNGINPYPVDVYVEISSLG